MSKKTENNKDKVFSQIYCTTDYEKFKLISSNRNINILNYNKLVKSMKEQQLIIPICVNESLEVIDGQHRLKAAQELKLPVYYYIAEGYSVAEMKRANLVSSNWKKDDFLNAYINENNPNYLSFNLLKTTYEISTSNLIRILAKVKKSTTSADLGIVFEEGALTISEEEEAQIDKFLTDLQDFKFFKEYNTTKFISAFLQLYFYPLYRPEIMKEKITKRSAALTHQLNRDQYLNILANQIYSYGGISNNIYYDTNRKRLYVPKR